MKNLISTIKNKKGLVFMGSVDDKRIEEAEKILDIHFSIEYKEYLKEFGVASFYGHELTGICNSERLNVINVTLQAREKFKNNNMYVIEDLSIDDVIIWQNTAGEVYQTIMACPPKIIATSLAEYLNKD